MAGFIIFMVLVSLATFQYSYAESIHIHDCGSTNGKVLDVQITGCSETDKQCVLKRNTNATINIDFEAVKDTDELKVIVHGLIMDIATPFPMPNPDACTDSGIECPIKAGNVYKFTTSLPILKIYPRVTVDIKFELKSEEDYVCVIIPAKLH